METGESREEGYHTWGTEEAEGCPRMVPEELLWWAGAATARRRMSWLALIVAAVLPVYVLLAALSVPVTPLGQNLNAVLVPGYCLVFLLCRSRLSDGVAVPAVLLLLAALAWVGTASAHFGHTATIDRFTAASVTALTMPLYVGMGRLPLSLAIIATMAGQPATAYLALRAGYLQGTLADLALSGLGAFIVGVVALAGVEVVQRIRDEAVRGTCGYELVRRLGAGGMGEVWEARHRFLVRPAAIKLFPGTSGKSRAVARFEREAQATALLTSVHTVRVFDFGQTEQGRLYYVMELLEGLDLQRLVTREGPLAAAHAVTLVEQACDAVGEAHGHGLVHRDLKPSNLFLVRPGLGGDFVKVLDFGLVGLSDQPSLLTRVDGHRVPGTPSYVPPEVLRGERHDARSDVYQLGCVLFFLLTGERVFSAQSDLSQAMAHLFRSPRQPSEVAPGIAADLDALVLACLDKEPAGRPRDGEALRDALAELECHGQWQREDGFRFFEALEVERISNTSIGEALRSSEHESWSWRSGRNGQGGTMVDWR